MWELDHKEGWAPKNWCFRLVVLEKTLESPLDSKEIKPVNPKRNQHWVIHCPSSNLLLWFGDFPSEFIRVFQRNRTKHTHTQICIYGFPSGSVCKELTCNARDLGSILHLGRSPGEEHGNPLQYSFLENPHGQKSLVGYSPWGRKELDMTERLNIYIHTHTHTHIYIHSQSCGFSLVVMCGCESGP